MKEEIVLMYHDILNSACTKSGFQTIGALQYVIDADAFQEQLNIAKDIENVCFSFDDGGCSSYEVIADILERFNKRGIFSIATKFIGEDYFLTKEQIKSLDLRGHIIASHSHSNPKKISNLSYLDCLKEWRQSKELLESIVGHDVTIGSIPGGAVSDMVIDCMCKAGYLTIYTSAPTTIKTKQGDTVICGRFGIKNSTSIEKFNSILFDPAARNQMLWRYRFLKLMKFLLGSRYNGLKQFLLKLKRLS